MRNRDILRKDRLPMIFCPGCGIYMVIKAFIDALNELKLDLNNTVVVSGIGCSGRISGYFNIDSLHTTHGRAIAYATGIKLFRPNLNLIVFTGDGDVGAIGIGHFLHTARRNIDMAVICINNLNYGLTGGQSSPTTPLDAWTYTTPYGNIEGFYDLCELAVAAGAVYVARWIVSEEKQLKESIKKAIKKKGFAYVEAVSPCVTNFGRLNDMKTSREMIAFFREREVRVEEVKNESREELRGKLIVGEFIDRERPEFTEQYWMLVRGVQDGTIKLRKPKLDWFELELRRKEAL